MQLNDVFSFFFFFFSINVWKGKIAGYQHCLFLPQCFQNPFSSELLKTGLVGQRPNKPLHACEETTELTITTSADVSVARTTNLASLYSEPLGVELGTTAGREHQHWTRKQGAREWRPGRIWKYLRFINPSTYRSRTSSARPSNLVAARYLTTERDFVFKFY